MTHAGVEDVLLVTADYFGVSVADMRSHRRSSTVHPARVWAVYLAAMTTDASFKVIGEQVGGRDHTVVRMYARARARDVATSNASANLYARLRARRTMPQ